MLWRHGLRAHVATENQLTLFHHADVDAALQTTGLAVAPVVLGDGAAPVERTGEGGFTLHAAPAGGSEGGGGCKCQLVHNASGRGEGKETNRCCSRSGNTWTLLVFYVNSHNVAKRKRQTEPFV